MDLKEAMKVRHSVRKFKEIPLEDELVLLLRQKMAELCRKSTLQMALITNEPKAFSGPLAHYGKFEGCANYIVLASGKGMERVLGYYGEELVLYAQTLGLHTCWVALTYKKSALSFTPERGKKVRMILAIGHGRHRGVPHKSKPLASLCTVEGEMPAWFRAGMEGALTAPTAINQQKFHFTLLPNGKVSAKALLGPYAKTDLGIAQLHFELGAGRENFEWDEASLILPPFLAMKG